MFKEFFCFLLRTVYWACFHLYESSYQCRCLASLPAVASAPLSAAYSSGCVSVRWRASHSAVHWMRKLCATVYRWGGSIHTRTTRLCDDWLQLGAACEGCSSWPEICRTFFFFLIYYFLWFCRLDFIRLCKHMMHLRTKNNEAKKKKVLIWVSTVNGVMKPPPF